MEWDVTNSFQRIFHQPQWEYHGNSMGYGAGDCPEMMRFPNVWHFFSMENNHETCWFNGI